MKYAYETERTQLRALEPEDINVMFDVFNDSDLLSGYMHESLPMIPYSREKFKNFVQKSINDDGEIVLVVEEKGTDKFIGVVNITPDYLSQVCDLSLFISCEFRNKKLGYEILKCVINMIFNVMNMREICLSVYDFNKAAIRLYEKLGFAIEAVLKDRAFRCGAYHDIILMHLSKDMFVKLDYYVPYKF